jgi:hypothetical protein
LIISFLTLTVAVAYSITLADVHVRTSADHARLSCRSPVGRKVLWTIVGTLTDDLR